MLGVGVHGINGVRENITNGVGNTRKIGFVRGEPVTHGHRNQGSIRLSGSNQTRLRITDPGQCGVEVGIRFGLLRFNNIPDQALIRPQPISSTALLALPNAPVADSSVFCIDPRSTCMMLRTSLAALFHLASLA